MPALCPATPVVLRRNRGASAPFSRSAVHAPHPRDEPVREGVLDRRLRAAGAGPRRHRSVADRERVADHEHEVLLARKERRSPRAKRAAACARLSPTPGACSSGGVRSAHARYASRSPPSNERKWISSSSASTTNSDVAAVENKASVSWVRLSRDVSATSIRSASSSRAKRTCLLDALGSEPSPGTVLDASRPGSSRRTRDDEQELRTARRAASGSRGRAASDRLVELDRRIVLGAHEEAHRGTRSSSSDRDRRGRGRRIRAA